MIIIFAVVAGFTINIYMDTKSYQQLAENHLENVVSLADTDISNRIDSSMSKPVMVSKTMANDEFLKTWLSKEPQSAGNNTYLKQLYSYLKAYQLKYDYTTVFCISAQTGNYYYQGGLNKRISKKDHHDIWYYNFISSGHEYDLEVDTNQANHNCITIFANFRVTGDNGKLLGVIGVGLKASFTFQSLHKPAENPLGFIGLDRKHSYKLITAPTGGNPIFADCFQQLAGNHRKNRVGCCTFSRKTAATE